MKFGRSACLAGMIALGAWSVAACSKDTTSGNTDGGTGGEDGGGSGGKGNGGSSSGGKGGSGGSSGSNTGGKGGSTGGSTSVDGGDAGVPTLTITSPKTGADVHSTTVDIVMDITNFTLKAPNSTDCPAGTCGHIHLNVDGNACNTTGAPYNNAGAATTIPIDLKLCPAATIPGAHVVDATLHNNDHSEVKVGGTTVGMSISINYVAGDAGADSGTK